MSKKASTGKLGDLLPENPERFMNEREVKRLNDYLLGKESGVPGYTVEEVAEVMSDVAKVEAEWEDNKYDDSDKDPVGTHKRWTQYKDHILEREKHRIFW